MADHPWLAMRTLGEGAIRMIAGPGVDTVRDYLALGSSRPLGAGLFLWNASLWGLAAVGAIAGLRSRYRAYWGFVIVTIGYVVIISAGDAAGARYRVPLIPLLALLAALGLQHLLRRMVDTHASATRRREERLVTTGSRG